jgi:hypothetical protein
MKKSKKRKRKGKESCKLKASKPRSAPPPLPPELRGLDTEWWYAFLHKHAESGKRRPKPPRFLSFPCPLRSYFLEFHVLARCIRPNPRSIRCIRVHTCGDWGRIGLFLAKGLIFW